MKKQVYKTNKNLDEIMYVQFIQDLLKEYSQLDYKYETRKNELLTELNINGKQYIKRQKEIEAYITNDKLIKVIKNRKDFLDDALSCLNKNNHRAYVYIVERFIEHKNLKQIMIDLKIDNISELYKLEYQGIKYIGNKMQNSKSFLKSI